MTLFKHPDPAQRRHDERGFTMLELLLVTGISAIMMLGITQLTQSWVETELATGGGQHMQRTTVAVQKFVETRWNELTPTNDAVLVGTTTPTSPWADLVVTLQNEGLINAAGRLDNPLGFELQITYNQVAVGTQIFHQAYVFSKTNALNKRVTAAARQAGNLGGTVTSFPDQNNAVGSFGQWVIPRNTIMASGPFPCAVTDTRGCLVSAISYSEETLRGPYLYRINMGDIDLNTMYTDLFMDNNDVVDANNIGTDNLNISNVANLGPTNVNGATTLGGPATINEGLTVNNGMNVTGDASFANNVTVNNGTVNTNQLNATTVQAPTLRTGTLSAQNMTVNGGMIVDDTISINGNVVMTRPNAEIFAGSINAGQINARNGALTVGRVDVTNAMDITGSIDVTGTIVGSRLVADQCIQINDPANGNPEYGPNCP
jgi:prepilin-type N-terminal cleavage/methylation domain-containing protein